MDDHDHDDRYAEQQHWHSGYEALIEELREDLNRAHSRITDLEELLRKADDTQPDRGNQVQA